MLNNINSLIGVVSNAAGINQQNQQNQQIIDSVNNQIGGNLLEQNPQPQTNFFQNQPSPLNPNIAAVTSNQAQNEVNQMTSFMNQQQSAPQIQDGEQEQQQQPLSEREQIQLALSSMQEQEASAFDEFQSQLDAYASGAFALSSDERNMIDDINRRFDILKRRQMVANQSLEGGFQTAQATTGLARYAPELAALEFNQVQNAGIEQLRQIDIELQQSLDAFMDNIKNSRIQGLKESYNMYNQRLKMRKDLLTEMRLNLNDFERFQNSLKTNEIREYEYALSQGYQGSFMQFKQQNRPQRAPSEWDLLRSGGLSFGGSGGGSIMIPGPDGNMQELSGQELTQQLSFSNPPSWFTNEYLNFIVQNKENLDPTMANIANAIQDQYPRAGKDDKDLGTAISRGARLKSAWNTFRNHPAISGQNSTVAALQSLGTNNFSQF